MKRGSRSRVVETYLILLTGLTIHGCTSKPALPDPPMAGGDTTLYDTTVDAMSNPAPNLSEEELRQHLDGDKEFEQAFVSSPADINPGLGPTYNNNACDQCHIRDGRGLPVTGQGVTGNTMMVVRASTEEGESLLPGGPIPLEGMDIQLHNDAIYGETVPVSVELIPVYESGTFPSDGEPYELRHWDIEIVDSRGKELPPEVMISARIPPPVFGLGLLEAVTDQTLIDMQDPDDADGDGISGRLNYVYDVLAEMETIGRYGWKATEPTLLQQAARDYISSMGVGTDLIYDREDGPEIDFERLEDVTFYTQTLAVPMRRDFADEEVLAGEELFISIGCEACHKQTLETGEHEIAAVSHQIIHPYTDLLLHQMGMGLADGREVYGASGTEWRTPPLWGIGLTSRVLGDQAFLHDGRARTIQEAILWHDGEAARSAESYRLLSATDREALHSFLTSL